MTTINIVAAYAHNNVIGRDDNIPWRVRSDLIHLKELTKNQIVILGRKTYDSMATYYDKSGRAMPAKKYIVMTRDKQYRSFDKNITIAQTYEDALDVAKDSPEVYVIGGMQIYNLALPHANRLYITEIDANIEGDAFFPAIDTNVFQEVSRESHAKDDFNEYDYTFVTYERTS
jgi:dihydrofolate reductase